ncbi:hypothetical protein D0Z08_28380 [Nocardioides immobilis]|uniref:Uncharacterized protein n=1 Tax=Nocardioides immobilis TaxID=2049295 RepID=A0A417XTC9_9ACTN|nr:hypothetical protein D0Z08_28380 [Nocardioides immobilis]
MGERCRRCQAPSGGGRRRLLERAQHEPGRGGVIHCTRPRPQAPQDRRDRAAPQSGHRPGPIGKLTKHEAAEQLGVSVPRINQILRRRAAGDPDQLTAAAITKIDSPRGRRTYKRRAGAIEPVFAQIKHNRTRPSAGALCALRQ